MTTNPFCLGAGSVSSLAASKVLLPDNLAAKRPPRNPAVALPPKLPNWPNPPGQQPQSCSRLQKLNPITRAQNPPPLDPGSFLYLEQPFITPQNLPRSLVPNKEGGGRHQAKVLLDFRFPILAKSPTSPPPPLAPESFCHQVGIRRNSNKTRNRYYLIFIRPKFSPTFTNDHIFLRITSLKSDRPNTEVIE